MSSSGMMFSKGLVEMVRVCERISWLLRFCWERSSGFTRERLTVRVYSDLVMFAFSEGIEDAERAVKMRIRKGTGCAVLVTTGGLLSENVSRVGEEVRVGGGVLERFLMRR